MNSSRPVDARFDAIVLGASGGIDESDLTSVLLTRAGRDEFIALDVGTLYAGLVRAAAQGSLPSRPDSKWSDAGEVLKQHLHGYFVSHPHLDHVAGLIITSPEAGKSTIHGLAPTLDALRAHVFGTALWANFTDEGEGAIGRFRLDRMAPGAPVVVEAAGVSVEAFPLSHGRGTTSTAFLVKADDAAALYLGDTGPDAVEGEGRLAALWRRVAPLIRARELRVVFLEVSFSDPREDSLLFGHLTPSWLMRELEVLAAEVDPSAPETALRGLPLVVTHLKPRLERGADVREDVRRQLAPLEQRGVKVVLPRAGERLSF
jgi:3',5'-cyclic-nucleotide phosphodiesterase